MSNEERARELVAGELATMRPDGEDVLVPWVQYGRRDLASSVVAALKNEGLLREDQ